jgi:hypothetical protein
MQLRFEGTIVVYKEKIGETDDVYKELLAKSRNSKCRTGL